MWPLPLPRNFNDKKKKKPHQTSPSASCRAVGVVQSGDTTWHLSKSPDLAKIPRAKKIMGTDAMARKEMEKYDESAQLINTDRWAVGSKQERKRNPFPPASDHGNKVLCQSVRMRADRQHMCQGSFVTRTQERKKIPRMHGCVVPAGRSRYRSCR